MVYRLALVGFGRVGQSFAEILKAKQETLRKDYELHFELVALTDPRYGEVYSPKGISLDRALKMARERKRFEDAGLGESGWDGLRVAREAEADLLVETTPTHLKDGEPGLSHIREALRSGKHVITTNKGPIALAYRELHALAEARGRELRFEGTVLSGTPTLNLVERTLAGLEILEIRGILNGTTNFILGEMERGKSFEEAVAEAQRLGYAEENPSADLEGQDALAKITILANVLMKGNLKVTDIPHEGIQNLRTEDIRKVSSRGKRLKLLSKASRVGKSVEARVQLEEVGGEDFLYSVQGVLNALTLRTDLLSEIHIVGPGAGGPAAGYALLSDLLEIHRLRGISSPRGLREGAETPRV